MRGTLQHFFIADLDRSEPSESFHVTIFSSKSIEGVKKRQKVIVLS
jgi:hypothetical protein